MKTRAWRWMGLSVWLAAGAAGAAEPAALPALTLQGTDGAAHALPAADARFTVLFFFARHCPVQRAHDERLKALALAYKEKGVAVLGVDSEPGNTPEAALTEAKERGYPFPLLVDKGAQLARAVEARFATYALIVDAQGQIRYRGGIDADKLRLREGSAYHLKDALDALLAGKAPPATGTKALGCTLRPPPPPPHGGGPQRRSPAPRESWTKRIERRSSWPSELESPVRSRAARG